MVFFFFWGILIQMQKHDRYNKIVLCNVVAEGEKWHKTLAG